MATTLIHTRQMRNFDSSRYRVERLQATSVDGVGIDITVLRLASLDVGGGGSSAGGKPHPMVLQGYGAYGISFEPTFDEFAFNYVDRGVQVAIAHVRGGSENGWSQWYDRGARKLTKRNTFLDFIACAEHLIDIGRAHPSTLAIEGRSAGGLLVGVVANWRPDLWRVCVAEVPFVDGVTTMCDATIPFTAPDWEEWGNPNESQEQLQNILSYSPVDNVGKCHPPLHGGRSHSAPSDGPNQPQDRRRLPDILITAGLHDPRVPYWEAVKWATRLRLHYAAVSGERRREDCGEVLLAVDRHGGHYAASDAEGNARAKAVVQAYVLSKIAPDHRQL